MPTLRDLESVIMIDTERMDSYDRLSDFIKTRYSDKFAALEKLSSAALVGRGANI